MSVDMNKVKGHPGFLAFGKSNVSTSNSEAAKEKEQDALESNKDQQLSGGEQGKAE